MKNEIAKQGGLVDLQWDGNLKRQRVIHFLESLTFLYRIVDQTLAELPYFSCIAFLTQHIKSSLFKSSLVKTIASKITSFGRNFAKLRLGS